MRSPLAATDAERAVISTCSPTGHRFEVALIYVP
jgi:hypothetical protein